MIEKRREENMLILNEKQQKARFKRKKLDIQK